MSFRAVPRRSAIADGVYGLLNPIPFGFFVAAMIFDITYLRSGQLQWAKGAAWLISIGLFIAIIPRLVNLAQVWITSRKAATRNDRWAFWLQLVAIVVAIFNALVHTRDAYAIVPDGVWLSVITVVLLSVSYILVAVQHPASGDFNHD